MTDSEDNEGCPVCQRHTTEDSLASQGMILTGMTALIERDDETIESVFGSLTPYDGHTAIALGVMFLNDLCNLTGHDLQAILAGYRTHLNGAQAHRAE